MALSLSRSDTNTTPDYWLAKPLTECFEWMELISEVHEEQERERKKKSAK